MTASEGGCLCGAVRYSATAEPIRITYCHCKFCQRATGTAYMVEPIFTRDAFSVIAGAPQQYRLKSQGSGKEVTINFCKNCGTKLFLEFERFADVIGAYGGTFDDPNWYQREAGKSKHIFLEFAQHGTVVPAGIAITFGMM